MKITRTRALAALAVGAAGFMLAGCSLLPGGLINGPNEDGSETVDVFTIKVGDCLNDGGIQGQVSDVEKVPCSEEHDSEAFASIILDDGAFPGDVAVEEQAVELCTAEFNAFVGVDYQASTLDFAYYYPTAGSWANGDREILCLIGDPAGPVTGSLKGAAR